MSFKVTANDDGVTYVITNFKATKDKDGNDVEVVDTNDVVTLQQLAAEKAKHTEAAAEIQKKIDAINNL